MKVYRQRMFDENDNSDLKAAALGIGGVAAIGSADIAGKALNKKYIEGYYRKRLKERAADLRAGKVDNQVLIDYAKKHNIPITAYPNSKDFGHLATLEFAGNLSGLSPKEEKMVREGLEKKLRTKLSDETFNKFKKEGVVRYIELGGGHVNNAVLAHEIGHHQSKTGQNKIGKVFEDLGSSKYNLGRGLVGAGSGFALGRSSVETKEDGSIGLKDNAKWKALGSLGIAAALVSPRFGREIIASRNGYKMLKESGASEKYLKAARDFYKDALGTYAARNITPAAMNQAGGHMLGLGAGYVIEGRKKKKK